MNTEVGKSTALLEYECQTRELRRRLQAGEINRGHYRQQKVEVLKRALPKLKLEELAELDRQSFDLLAEQRKGRGC